MARSLIVCCVLLLVSGALAADVCMLKMKVSPDSSRWRGGGGTTAPFNASITPTAANATGSVWLAVPGPDCPPKITAANAAETLEKASLALQTDADTAVTFKPADMKANVTRDASDPDAVAAVFNFNGLSLGLAGNAPLGPEAVVVGSGSTADAEAAAQPLCAQMLLLNGTLDVSSFLGPRTSNVRHVAFNRTLGAGLAVKKTGADVSTATMFLRNVTLFFNISPEATPGVEMSRARYLLGGNLVATADLSDAKAWSEEDADELNWATTPRLDAPVVMGSERVPKPRYVGVNATMPQECSVDAAPGDAAAAAAAASAARGTSSAGSAGAVLGTLAAAALLAAGLL